MLDLFMDYFEQAALSISPFQTDSRSYAKYERAYSQSRRDIGFKLPTE